MRTLSEIVDDMIEGKIPSHEECYWALQAYRFMLNMEHRQLREELLRSNRESEEIRKMRAEISFDMYKSALNKSPKEWCGVEEVLPLKQRNCKHKNKDYYNHGYHCVCLDCGKDLD